MRRRRKLDMHICVNEDSCIPVLFVYLFDLFIHAHIPLSLFRS
jgi:hypothetical protein